MKLGISLAAFFLLTTGNATAQSPTSANSIAGKVVDALTGNPMPHAQLTLQIKSDEASATADSSGKFLFDHLEPGKYQLYARAAGYSSQGLDQHGSFFTGVVVGNGLDSEHIVFRLHPQGVIFGRVTDDRGEAVRNATVLIVSQTQSASHRSLASQSQTNDLGEYRFAGLLPGEYFVAVSTQPWYAQTAFRYVPEQPSDAQSHFGGFGRAGAAKLDPALDAVYPLTFYPGVTDERAATELNLHEGETQQADIPLRAVPAVHIRLANLPPDQAASPSIGAHRRIFGAVNVSAALQIAQISPGEVEIAGLPPGDLILSLNPKDGESQNAQHLEVSVSGEATVDASKASPSAAVSGRVIFPQGSGAVGDAGALVLRENYGAVSARVKKDGTFSFPALRVGRYNIFVNLSGQPKYVQKIIASGAKIEGRRLLITGSGEVQLTILIGGGFGQIDGVAILDENPADGVLVLLVPEFSEDLDADLRIDQSDSDGSFTLANITPGKYRLLAIRDGWDLDYRDPAVIKPYLAKAQYVEVDPNGIKKLTVEVQPLLK